MALELLSGVRVLDLSQYIPGPYAAQVLADLGAEVVKLEPPAGDPMRHFDPPDADGLAASYKLVNAGKRVIRVDLKSAAGQAALAQLLGAVDVLVESFRPGTLERLGFDRARISALNPGLVHVALSGFGQDGPYRLRAGHDLTYMALGGGLVASGTAATPVMTCPPMSDHASALQAVLAVCAALFARTHTGRGAFLDVSMMETVLGWQGIPLTFAARGMAPERGSTLLTGGGAYYQIYRTADDRFVALGALEEKFWRIFCTCAAVARPDWVARQDEPMPQTSLIAELAALFATRSQADWVAALAGVDCCFEPVPEFQNLAQHPHIAARGQVVPSSSGPEPLVETLLGLRVDGGPPPARPPLREDDVSAVLQNWGARTGQI